VRHLARLLVAILISTGIGSCAPSGPAFVAPPIETRFSFLNFSTQLYATLGIREHLEQEPAAAFTYTPLLAPGATTRVDFRTFTAAGCPASIDLRLLLYRRVNNDVPIGLDEGECVEPTPIVAGEILDLPAGNVQLLETYTIVNWEAPEGFGRVKIAQCSLIDEAIRGSGLFENPDAVWEITGVDPNLAAAPPTALAESAPIIGRVVLADGTGVQGVGVLVRTRFRVRLDCSDPANETDAGYGEPIAYTMTDACGAFGIDRPGGVYQLEFFSDEFAFRPGILRVETPLDEITVLAEPL